MLAAARRDGLRRLLEPVEGAAPNAAIAKRLRGWLERDGRPMLEALFSVLWRARCRVLELFPDTVRSIVETKTS